MAFAVMRIQKLKTMGAIAGAYKHNERKRDTPNADPARSVENQQTVSTGNKDIVTAFREKIGDQKIRKNAVLGVEIFFSASPEYFRPHNPELAGEYDLQPLRKWKETTMQWLDKKYGERIVSATLHVDEATPHIHALLVPLDDRGKLNCRSLFGGTRHTLSKLQTEYSEAVSSLGLERGIENSRGTHQKVSRFYRLTQGKENPELPLNRSYKEVDLPGKLVRMSDEQLARFSRMAALNGAMAQKEADTQVIVAISNKNKVLERENTYLKKQNSLLTKEKKKWQELANNLRGIDPEEVLTKMFRAKGPYSRQNTSKCYLLPNSEEVKFVGTHWKTSLYFGKGAINLVMALCGYDQSQLPKALSELAHTFGENRVVGEVGAKAREQARSQVKIALRQFTPKKRKQERSTEQNFSR